MMNKIVLGLAFLVGVIFGASATFMGARQAIREFKAPMTLIMDNGLIVTTMDDVAICRDRQHALADGARLVSTSPWGERFEVISVACGDERPGAR